MAEELEDHIEVEEEAPAVEPPPESDPEAEAEARKYGWKPREDFTLAPEGWVDAARFLELPSTQVKITRDLNKRLEREARESREQLARVGEVTRVAVERMRQQEREAYEARVAEIERERRAAVEQGDTQRYDRLTEAQKAIKPPEPVAEPPPQGVQIATDAQEYLSRTKWASDPAAYKYAGGLIERNPHVMHLPHIKQVQWVDEQLRNSGLFAEHFEAPAPKPGPAVAKVDPGGLGGMMRRGKSGADLPPDVRKVGEEFVKEGIFANLDEYARDYFGDSK